MPCCHNRIAPVERALQPCHPSAREGSLRRIATRPIRSLPFATNDSTGVGALPFAPSANAGSAVPLLLCVLRSFSALSVVNPFRPTTRAVLRFDAKDLSGSPSPDRSGPSRSQPMTPQAWVPYRSRFLRTVGGFREPRFQPLPSSNRAPAVVLTLTLFTPETPHRRVSSPASPESQTPPGSPALRCSRDSAPASPARSSSPPRFQCF